MLKILFQSFYQLFGCILIFLGGIAADTSELIGFNIVDYVKKHSRSSYIIVVLIFLVIFLTCIIVNLYKEWKKSLLENSRLLNKQQIEKADIVNNANEINQVDISLLDQISTIFSGSAMHNFFELLQQSRSMKLSQADQFEQAISRFTSPDKKFRSHELEQAKREFLSSLQNFLTFTDEKFNSSNSITCRFYGGISEYDLMTTYQNQYEEDENSYLELVRDLYAKWKIFQDTIHTVVPNYEWKG